jgi:DNA invertase Pin-like site-specific DNA recombinase
MSNNKKNKPYTALYCRVATSDAEAMAWQENLLRRFAKESGYGYCVCYRDNGVNGRSLDRPAMQELMADVSAGKISRVVARNISRIVRNTFVAEEWLTL